MQPGGGIAGLRPGERRHEILKSADETLVPTAHPKIQAVRTARPIPRELDRLIDQLAAAAESCGEAQVMALIGTAVPEFGRREVARVERGSA